MRVGQVRIRFRTCFREPESALTLSPVHGRHTRGRFYGFGVHTAGARLLVHLGWFVAESLSLSVKRGSPKLQGARRCSSNSSLVVCGLICGSDESKSTARTRRPPVRRRSLVLICTAIVAVLQGMGTIVVFWNLDTDVVNSKK